MRFNLGNPTDSPANLNNKISLNLFGIEFNLLGNCMDTVRDQPTPLIVQPIISLYYAQVNYILA